MLDEGLSMGDDLGFKRDPLAVPVAFLALLSVVCEASSVYVVG